MSTASLELCKELVNISSWGDDTEFVYYVNGSQYSGEVYHRTQVFAKPGNIPAYDLGYLLRKLPGSIDLTRHGASGIWRAYANTGANADTPEDATCKLAIKLFKQGVLK